MNRYLAFDLGAESGRAILGTLDGARLAVEEIHRFPNTPVRVRSSLYWDALRLFHEIGEGLRLALRERLDGIGVDTWGVDFALLDANGALLDNPRHYRDLRTRGMMDAVFSRVPRHEVFEQTGIQFMPFNSLYQLFALRGSAALDSARTLLFMPDLFHYWLTGARASELTIASTSQFYNPRARRWATELLDALDLPASILPGIVPPGTPLGALDGAAVPVFATACHDTASAVAAVPASGADWCYISSGTWSL
ncbi:MAG: rhamnulokinase, partial [Bryobacteraceae bacterium]